MRIIISVQSICHPMTGIGRYTLELSKSLAKSSRLTKVVFFDGISYSSEVPKLAPPAPPQLASSEGTSNRLFKSRLLRNKYSVYVYRRLVGNRFSQYLYKRMNKANTISNLHKSNQYLYHGTNYDLPQFPGKKIVTIHDLSILTMPEFHPIERVNFLAKEIKRSIDNADAIITDSLFIKEEIVEHFEIDQKHIHVVNLAHSGEFFQRDELATLNTLNKYGLSHGQYTLYAGTIEPRKNISNLINSYSLLPQTIRSKYPLVLVGHKGWNNEGIFELIENAQKEGWLIYLGFVPEDDLPLLYSGARLFAFPSIYEGFGLPVLEAMASGVPVVSSNRSSLPEVCGGAALLCDPNDIEGLTAALLSGVTDESWRSAAINKGLTRAQSFSWARCGDETIDIYEKYSAV